MRIGVIGGGLFGLVASIDLARLGFEVTLLEAASQPLSHASRVNQARLHTGMHYPRDFETAKSSLEDYEVFKTRFAASVREIEQFYAVAQESKVSFSDFAMHAQRLGLDCTEANAQRWFRPGRVEGVLRVPEATFDAQMIRLTLLEEAETLGKLRLNFGKPVHDVSIEGETVSVTSEDSIFTFDRLLIASYAMNSKFARRLEIKTPPVKNQLTEVLLGRFTGLQGVGLTVMDGDYWSSMPFGFSEDHSLTSVTYTPLLQSSGGLLDCQVAHASCGRLAIESCGDCVLRPSSNRAKMLSAVSDFLNPKFEFKYRESLFTVKSVFDDQQTRETAARPTSIFFDESRRVGMVHSGKIAGSLRVATLVSSQGGWI